MSENSYAPLSLTMGHLAQNTFIKSDKSVSVNCRCSEYKEIK